MMCLLGHAPAPCWVLSIRRKKPSASGAGAPLLLNLYILRVGGVPPTQKPRSPTTPCMKKGLTMNTRTPRKKGKL
jgi:hypothetical protein